ncbi:MAG: hypothetical protein FWJ34_05140 [Geminocystis sp. GBBB08]|nr:hypothetical protein [Geminocystis sp. GBBB08]
MLEGYEDNQEKTDENYDFTTSQEYGESVEKSGEGYDFTSQRKYSQSSPKSEESHTLLFDKLQEKKIETSGNKYTFSRSK